MALNNLNRFLEGVEYITIHGRERKVENNLIHNVAYGLHGKDRCEICGLSNDMNIKRNSCRLHMHCNDKDYHNLSKKNWQCLCCQCHSAVENYSKDWLKNYIKENMNKNKRLDIKEIYAT